MKQEKLTIKRWLKRTEERSCHQTGKQDRKGLSGSYKIIKPELLVSFVFAIDASTSSLLFSIVIWWHLIHVCSCLLLLPAFVYSCNWKFFCLYCSEPSLHCTARIVFSVLKGKQSKSQGLSNDMRMLWRLYFNVAAVLDSTVEWLGCLFSW